MWGLGGWGGHPIVLTLTPPVKEASSKESKFTHSKAGAHLSQGKGRQRAFFVLQAAFLPTLRPGAAMVFIQAALVTTPPALGPLSSPRLLPPGSPFSLTQPTGAPRAQAHCLCLRPTWPVSGASAHPLPGRSQVAPIRVIATGAGAQGRGRSRSEKEASSEKWVWLGDNWEPRS